MCYWGGPSSSWRSFIREGLHGRRSSKNSYPTLTDAQINMLIFPTNLQTFVSHVDPRDLAETFEVRRALEMLAGELGLGVPMQIPCG